MLRISVVLSLLFFNTIVLAQEPGVTEIADLSLSDLMNVEVSVASMKPENIMEAPGIVSTIYREEIDAFAADKLGEILNRVVSASFLSANVLTKNLVDFRAQAFTPYNNHTLFLINGRPIRDPITGGLNAALLMNFPTQLIDRIEIIRGPGSVLYGSCAFSGVINIITINPSHESIHVNASAEGGNLDYWQYSANASLQKKELAVTFGFNTYNHAGENFDFVDYNGVDSSANFWEKGFGIIGTIDYNNFRFTSGLFEYRPYTLGGADNSWSQKWGDKEQHLSYFTNLGYTVPFEDKGKLSFDFTRNQHTWHTYRGKVMFANDLMGEVSYNHDFELFDLLIGGTYGSAKHESDYFNNGSESYGSLFFQADYWVNKKLKAVVGLQYNNLENQKHNVSPRGAIIYKFTKNTGIKVLYGQAFRKGYPLETSFIIPQLLGNTELKPELISTLESEFYVQKKKYKLSTTVYYSYVYNIIHRTPYNQLGDLMYDNGPTHQFWGIEFDSKTNINDALYFTGSFNYQQNKSDRGVMNATLHPNLMVKGGIIYKWKGFSLGLFNSFFGAPTPVKAINPNVREVNPPTSAYSLLSAKLMYRIKSVVKSQNQLHVFIKGQNLLNSDIRYPEFTSKGVNTLIPLQTSIKLRAGLKIDIN